MKCTRPAILLVDNDLERRTSISRALQRDPQPGAVIPCAARDVATLLDFCIKRRSAPRAVVLAAHTSLREAEEILAQLQRRPQTADVPVIRLPAADASSAQDAVEESAAAELRDARAA